MRDVGLSLGSYIVYEVSTDFFSPPLRVLCISILCVVIKSSWRRLSQRKMETPLLTSYKVRVFDGFGSFSFLYLFSLTNFFKYLTFHIIFPQRINYHRSKMFIKGIVSNRFLYICRFVCLFFRTR